MSIDDALLVVVAYGTRHPSDLLVEHKLALATARQVVEEAAWEVVKATVSDPADGENK